MSSPSTVSLIIANCNHGHYLNELLADVFAQTRRPDEVIVVDDVSTDDSMAVLESFAAKERTLRILRNNTNQGTNFSANRGLAAASGKYVTFHSAKNRLAPHFLERTLAMLEQYPSAGLCCSFFAHLDFNTGNVGAGDLGWSNVPHFFPPLELAHINMGGGIPGHSSIYLRELFVEYGGLPSELEWHSDWFVTHVIAARHGFCYLPELLAIIRINDPKSYSNAGRRQWDKQRIAIERMLNKLFSAEFLDVVPFFQSTSLLSGLFDDVLRYIMEDPLSWSPEALVEISQMFHPAQQETMATRLQMAITVIEGLHPNIRAKLETDPTS
jgi:glycosyltransferase involved in cell wall biosynthesis